MFSAKMAVETLELLSWFRRFVVTPTNCEENNAGPVCVYVYLGSGARRSAYTFSGTPTSDPIAELRKVHKEHEETSE
jgi:hypothetical protein